MNDLLTQRKICGGKETILLFPGRLEIVGNSNKGTAECSNI